ncbi:MAG: GAF domain-containing sensor histidine kinase [Pleurocapsa minor GSE-CHR-MK-17-07R]|jgi:signal transduction histidine kinase|nr:GAF domain-containing sensor histidine kinase [Pleurocapsa minor GSE-CHR-MK 17-07R]
MGRAISEHLKYPYILLLVLSIGIFAVANYGQAAQWVFGDCDVIYFTPEYRPNCMLWRTAIMNTGLTPAFFEGYFIFLRVAAALPFIFLSIVLMRQRGGDLRVILLAGFLLLVGTAGPIYNPFWQWSTAWFTFEHQLPALPMLNRLLDFLLSVGTLMFVFLFPDGKFVPGWARWISFAWLIMRGGDVFFPDTPLSLYSLAYPVAVTLNTTFTLCAVGALIWRYRVHTDAVQRQQIKWITAGALLLALNYALDYTVFEIYPAVTNEYLVATREQGVLWELIQDTLWYLSQIVFSICLGLAVFRHRLWDIDAILSRTLVYGTLTLLIITLYVMIVGSIGALLHSQTTTVNGLIATGIIAVLFQPLRDRLQRGVDRLLYGDRDDPAVVFTRLAHQLQTTDTRAAILPNLAHTIAQTLKIPYVAIQLPAANLETQLAATWGENREPAQHIPLIYRTETVGNLLVAQRSPHEQFNQHEQTLLSAIAALTATTVRAVQMWDELQQSRQRLVTTREEERRRLRRDLHDGLGPALASLPLKVDAAIDLMESDRDTSIRLLGEVKRLAQQLVGDVRQVVNDLRPPTLDELGLVEAIRGALAHLHSHPSSPLMLLEADSVPRQLPAAIEAVSYRIIMEAVTNVVKHAHAHHCTIALRLLETPPALEVTIEDDGVGLPEKVQANVGLRSMRERAEELGGTLFMTTTANGGTCITVSLPLLGERE